LIAFCIYFDQLFLILLCHFLAVIRSGDYYMFEEDSDEDEISSVDVQEREERLEDEDDDKIGPLQILDAAFKVGSPLLA
jgi:hypothetical protein